MKQINTRGIILGRTDYGEADRILNILTPDQGKISGIAKGVRKSKSKLAGSIELFSVSELSFIIGRSEIYTIASARLDKHYSNIVSDLKRSDAGYEFIRIINKATEANAEAAYFELLQISFESLDEPDTNPDITRLWFNAQVIKLAGHSPDLRTDTDGKKLTADQKYNFDLDNMHFIKAEQGVYDANHIKFLRLCFAAAKPQILGQVQGAKKLADHLAPLVSAMLQNFVRV